MDFVEILSQYFPYGKRAEPDSWWLSYIELSTEWLYPVLGWVFLFLTVFLTRETHNEEPLQNMEAQLQQISAGTESGKGCACVKRLAELRPHSEGLRKYQTMQG